MTHRLLVQYGRPTDPSAFDQHYREVHVPLARKIPGVVRMDIGHAEALDGEAAPYLVAVLDFASAEAFAAGMQSPEGAAAAAWRRGRPSPGCNRRPVFLSRTGHPAEPPGRQAVQRRLRDLVRAAPPDHGGDRDEAPGRLAELSEARRILLAG